MPHFIQTRSKVPERQWTYKRTSVFKLIKLPFPAVFLNNKRFTCSFAEVFPSADLGLLGGLSMRGSARRECLAIAFGPGTSLGMALIPR